MGSQERKRQKRIKEYVIARDGLQCCYCDKELILETVTMEHIVPDSRKGTFNSTNLTVSCSEHNNKRGNKPFFEYCKQFDWPDIKLDKYKKLYFNNLRIKVLNIAKEECLPRTVNQDGKAIPNVIIRHACQVLKIKSMDFSDFEKISHFEIKFSELSEKKKIKFCFEQLIRIIESDT